MNIITIKCPTCGAEKKFSLVDSSYDGPQRCWKCRKLFTISIYNNEVRSCEPLEEEEEQSQQEEPTIPGLNPERRRDYSRPFNYGEQPARTEPESPDQTEPGNPAADASQDNFRAFTTPKSTPASEPEKPQEKISPPDRFRTFIPPAT